MGGMAKKLLIAGRSNVGADIVVGQLNGFWILAAPATRRALRRWGLYNIDTTLPNVASATTPDPNSGTYNTNVLTSATYANVDDSNGSIGAPAAKYCRFELGKAYDLPNKEELDFLYQNRAAIDSADKSGGAATLAAISAGSAPGSTSTIIWSSTEGVATGAYGQAFSVGSRSIYNKFGLAWVVPIRRIPA